MPKSLLGETSRTKGIAERALAIEISAIKEMPMLVARDVPDAIRLDQGIPSFRVPKAIREYLAEAIRSVPDIGKYSLQPGMPALREAISQDLKRRLGVGVDPDKEIFVSAGSIEALDCTARTLIDRGDEVIFFSPAYEPHINQVKLAEGTPVYVPLRKEDWRPDIAALEKAITEKTKAIYVCNPANPTGTVFTREEIEAIVAMAMKRDIFVIADEAYDFLVYDGKPHVSLLSFFPDMKENLVVCKTFSKQLAMTGYRIGYMVTGEGIMQHVLKPHDAAEICAPTPSQYAALWALSNPKQINPIVGSFRRELQERRDLIYERLSQSPEVFHPTKPEGAYYAFPQLVGNSELPVDSYEFSRWLLYTAKVSCVPGYAFGPGGEGHARFMFGAPQSTINRAFDRIEQHATPAEYAKFLNSLRN
ncbi:MAG: pyridoxal phosphate-dependent aminotransferase [Candidatus Aenigmarchaeota archaeon]|nr:pyridoxal phosphate-dependent aminotransferase [Candidatus Aenigmarchaeota archaeon]